MSRWDSPIIRINGFLNTVNDEVIGGVAGISGASKFAAQLGQNVWFDGQSIQGMYDSSVGTLYPGRYRYVKFRSADTPAYAVGQAMFWDTTVSSWQDAYQVTREEDLSSVDNAIMFAGVYLGGPEAGNYGFIQDLGIATVQFRTTLTAVGAVGSRVFLAGAGDGADEGFFDVIDSANPTLFSDVSLMLARYVGNAVTAPTNATASTIVLREANYLP